MQVPCHRNQPRQISCGYTSVHEGLLSVLDNDFNGRSASACVWPRVLATLSSHQRGCSEWWGSAWHGLAVDIRAGSLCFTRWNIVCTSAIQVINKYIQVHTTAEASVAGPSLYSIYVQLQLFFSQKIAHKKEKGTHTWTHHFWKASFFAN